MPSIPRFLWEYQLPVGLVLFALVIILYLFSWYKDVNHDRRDLRSLLQAIQKDIREIKDKLSGTPAATTSGSPLQLSEYGKKLAKCLDAEKWAANKASELLPEMQGKDAYEIQQYCNTYVFDKFQPTIPQDRLIRDCMYQNGATRTHVNEVLSLVLRDEALARLDMIHLAP